VIANCVLNIEYHCECSYRVSEGLVARMAPILAACIISAPVGLSSDTRSARIASNVLYQVMTCFGVAYKVFIFNAPVGWFALLSIYIVILDFSHIKSIAWRIVTGLPFAINDLAHRQYK